MDSDIHFGEVEESPPQRQLRPDQNRHYAVVSYAAPSPKDLPIYVDVDVLREMEAHALSNTNVELGGVLLGGHYEDHEGEPFVVISDSLRAEYYEATKGSFKFTHETWRDITRQRDEFPPGTQMVGWYHTHPGWGVFLSGMDTFICDHFFNKDLDVALVIDPCQSERVFFQWTSGEPRQKRATNGFYLTGSRFRLPELEIYAAQLEGRTAMPSDPRYSPLAGGYPPPVVQVAETRQTWLSVAVLGMLMMQFLVLALIAWKLLSPANLAQTAADERRVSELAAERELLDRVIGKLDVAPDGVVQTLEDQRRKNEELESVALGLNSHIRELKRTQTEAARQHEQLQGKTASLLARIDRLAQQKAEARETIETLREKLEEFEQTEGADDAATLWGWMKRWKWYLTGGGILLLAVIAALFAIYGPTEEDAAPPSDAADASVAE